MIAIRSWVAAVVVLAGGLLNARAFAQAPADVRPWEIGVHVGGTWSTDPENSPGRLPPPRATIPASLGSPTPSRFVSSWLFGDGALELNQALASSRASERIVPLDDVLLNAFVRQPSGGSVGFRVGRRLTNRVGVEFDLDYGLAALPLGDKAEGRLEETRDTFETSWNRLLDFRFAGSHMATASVSIDSGHRRRIISSGVAIVQLRAGGRIRPYVAGGAGASSFLGRSPSATIVGDYQFTISPGIPQSPAPVLAIHEVDRVTVRSDIRSSMAWILGGGVNHMLGARWGVRGDVRDRMARTVVTTAVDAEPTAIRAVPDNFAGMVFLGVNPTLMFSTPPRQSTLSGPAISGFETLRSTGITHHVNASLEVFWRF